MNNSSQVRTVQAAQTSFLLREHPDGSAGSTPVLLLHGVPETASCWKQVAPHLAEGRRVLAPDLPGLGGSSYPGPFDVSSLVSQLAALVETEVPGGRVDVVGHDWGGSLALALAGARPELLRRLVVVNAPYRQVPLLRAAYIPFLALPVAPELLFKLGGRRVVDAVLATLWKASTSLDEESRAEYWAAYTDPVKIAAMLGYYRAATRPRLARLVLRDGVPVPKRRRVQAEKALVLWGAADPILPVSLGEGVVRDLGADCVMVTVPGAGHFVIEEAPEVVTRVLLDFLADETTPAAAPAAPPGKAAKEHEPIEPPPGVVDEPAAPARRAPARKATRASAAASTSGRSTAATSAAQPPAAQPPAGQKSPAKAAAARAAQAPARKPARAAAPVASADVRQAAPPAKAPGRSTAPAKAPAGRASSPAKAPAGRASSPAKAPATAKPPAAAKAPAAPRRPAPKAPAAAKTAAPGRAPAPVKKPPAAKAPARRAGLRTPPVAQAPAAEPPATRGPAKKVSARGVPANNPPAMKKAPVSRPRRNQP